MHVAAHELTDPDLPSVVSYMEEHELQELDAALAGHPEISLGLQHSTNLWLAAAARISNDRERMLRYLERALDAGVLLFAFTSGYRRDLPLASGPLEIPKPNGSVQGSDGMTWQDCFGLSLALRRPAASRFLVKVADEECFDPQWPVDEYHYAVVDCMANFWQGDPSWREDREAVQELSREETQRDELEVRADLSLLDVLAALADREAAAVNRALANSLIAFRASWSRRNFSHHLAGALAPRVLGWAAFANDQGISLDVTSDYVPDWLARSSPDGSRLPR